MNKLIENIGKVVVWLVFGIVMFIAGWIIRAIKARSNGKKAVKEAEVMANAK